MLLVGHGEFFPLPALRRFIRRSYSLINDRTADFLGRRLAMTAECLIFMVGVIVQITSNHVWAQFAVGRLISGLSVGALSAEVPIVRLFLVPTYRHSNIY